ncbi:MAG: NERD domain-containing protein/DEAD/DEAH box helicase [Pirellulaceae bacterium]
MTRMIPATIHPHVKSGAERRMFGVIRETPNTDEWVCLHSLGLARHARKRRGEIDFLLLTRTGVFVLEVKGGGVKRIDGVWQFTDRYGTVHRKSEGPFDQAASAMFALEADINRQFKDDAKRSRLLFGFGVILPDVRFHETGSESDPRQVYDFDDRQLPFSDFVQRLSAYARETDKRSRYSPTTTDIHELVDFLRPDFDLVPPLAVQMDDASAKLLALEKEQYAVIDAWEQYGHPRVIVQGGAGTGKTLLAMEAAIREARKGKGGVLLVCFNQLLARYLKLVAEARQPEGGIEVTSVFSLLNTLIQLSRYWDEFSECRANSSESEIYRELYPEFAQRAVLDSQPQQVRTLIVDEAQDMMTLDLFDILDACLEGGLKEGRWRVFCDVNNQASVFGRYEDDALERLLKLGQTAYLVTNRRNTIPVADETAMLTRPRIVAPALIAGVPVQYSWYANLEAQRSGVSKTLGKLVAEGVTPSRITVLSPRSIEQCCASGIDAPLLSQITRTNVGDLMAGKMKSVSYATVSSFKGLENDFILLTDIEDVESEWWRSVIYVGMSRARVGLHLFMAEALRSTYDSCIRQWIEERTKDEADR